LYLHVVVVVVDDNVVVVVVVDVDVGCWSWMTMCCCCCCCCCFGDAVGTTTVASIDSAVGLNLDLRGKIAGRGSCRFYS